MELKYNAPPENSAHFWGKGDGMNRWGFFRSEGRTISISAVAEKLIFFRLLKNAQM